MGMDDIWLEVPNGLSQLGNLAEVSPNSISVHTEKLAVNALFFNGFNLLRDERSVMTFFAAGDDEDSHKRLKQPSASEFEEGPGKLHGENNKAPGCQKLKCLLS